MGLALGAALPAWGQEVEVATPYEFSSTELTAIEIALMAKFELAGHSDELLVYGTGSPTLKNSASFCGIKDPGTDAERLFLGGLLEGSVIGLVMEDNSRDRVHYIEVCLKDGMNLGEYAKYDAEPYAFSERELRDVEYDLRAEFELSDAELVRPLYGSVVGRWSTLFCGYLRDGAGAEHLVSGTLIGNSTSGLRLARNPSDRAIYEQLCHEFGINLGEYAGQAE